MNQRSWGHIFAILTAALFIALLLAIVLSYRPHRSVSSIAEGQPLLGSAPESFIDSQTGLQFKPPTSWSLQARSSATPKQHLSPRLIVKFKRLIPGEPVAWLRVSVIDSMPGQKLSDYLKTRKPPESDWKMTVDID